MTNLEKCRDEIIEVLKKYDASLTVEVYDYGMKHILELYIPNEGDIDVTREFDL